jgi:hypothetical protein
VKMFSELVREQQEEVNYYKKIALDFVQKEIIKIPDILGVLLAGSAARGDARKSPYGFMIDIIIVIKNGSSIDMEERFGIDTDPDIPFHCIRRAGEDIALEVRDLQYLHGIREQAESVIFAKQESIILFDRTSEIERWKNQAFLLTDADIRRRSLEHYFRLVYLTGEYRNEKWSYREAWIQITQNYNEATECYCSFLYCINGSFIPRKDWLVYLTYRLKEKPKNHEQLIEKMYRSKVSEEELTGRLPYILEAKTWMESYCRKKGWI